MYELSGSFQQPVARMSRDSERVVASRRMGSPLGGKGLTTRPTLAQSPRVRQKETVFAPMLRVKRGLMGTCSRLFAAIVFSALLLVTSWVSAAGFEMPDNGTRALARGGAFTALADDLTAIAHNPGALIKLRGSSVLLGNHVFFVHERFTRAQTFLEEDRFANAELYGLTPLEKV